MNRNGADRYTSTNGHLFLRGILLFGFSMLFYSLIVTGNIQYYIAPRMMPFIYFAMVVFFVLSVLQILRSISRHPEHEEGCSCEGHHHLPRSSVMKTAVYSIFLLPLLSGFLLPDQMLDSSVAANRGVNIGGGVYSNQTTDLEREKVAPLQDQDTAAVLSDGGGVGTSPDSAEDYMAELEKITERRAESGAGNGASGQDPAAAVEGDAGEEHVSYDDIQSTGDFDSIYENQFQEAQQADVIHLDDDNFLDMMSVLDMHLDELRGKEVELMGFVHREEGIDRDEMVVARFSMTCCTADTSVFGLLVQGEETNQFQIDDWVRVRGTLDEARFGEWTIPTLHLNEVWEVEPPDTPYVYPSFTW